MSRNTSSSRPFAALSLDSAAGVMAPLGETGLTQAELNAEGAGPGNPAANAPQPTEMDWKLMAQQQAELLKRMSIDQTAKDALIAKQAADLAARSFFTHQVGGTGGSDPITDDSVRLVDLPDGKQAIDIRVYLNKTAQRGKSFKGKFPITVEDPANPGKRIVKMHNGKPVYPEYDNWDLGRTTIRECPIVVQTTKGPVTIQGMATINVGRYTEDEVITRADTQASNLNKAHLSDATISEDGQTLVGSDKDS